MTNTNSHGLSRDIPNEVKREVRQRCGFGCVVCGGAIIQYDHFEPEFADAHAHKSEGIILLCGGCHNLKTVGRLSKETLAKHAADPKCRQTGFSFGPFDIGTTPPKVSIGEITAENVDVLLRIHGEDINKAHAGPGNHSGRALD